MYCLDRDRREGSGVSLSSPPDQAGGRCMEGAGEQKCGLLELPVEVLSRVLLYLPSSSLIACLHVDPLLWAIIREEHFLDMYTRRSLGLSGVRDRDVRFRDVPQEWSLLMELWFLSYDADSSFQDGARSFRRRDGLFFGLDCFQHSLLTWLAQATTAGTPLVKHISNSDQNMLCSLSKLIEDLPRFVVEPLTKLMIAFPELIEATVLTTHMSLHKGAPLTLHQAWHDGIQGEIKEKFECLYSLEIICGQTIKSVSFLSALIISFSSDRWIVWTGNVTQFPGCRFVKTLSLVHMSTSSTVSDIKERCASVREVVCEHTVTDGCVNEEWKRNILYPGLCHRLNQINRKDNISLIETICSNSADATVTILDHQLFRANRTGCHHNCAICSSSCMPYKQIQDDSIYRNNYKSHSHLNYNSAAQKCARAQEEQHQRKTLEVIHYHQSFDNIVDEHKKCDLHYKNDGVYDNSRDMNKGMNSVKNNSQFLMHDCVLENLTPLDVQKDNLVIQIEAYFRHEILRYICDPDSHQVLCPSCCKLWFPSNESLTKCITQIKSMDFVPTVYWPYHILNETVVLLTEVCR